MAEFLKGFPFAVVVSCIAITMTMGMAFWLYMLAKFGTKLTWVDFLSCAMGGALLVILELGMIYGAPTAGGPGLCLLANPLVGCR